MTHRELIELLMSKGFTNGWCLRGENLTIWEHDEEPPAPLIRPEAQSE